MIKIKISVDVCSSSICSDRIMQKLINKNFRELLEDGEAYEYPLNDTEYASTSMFVNLVSYINTDESSPYFGKMSEESIKSYVINSGITPMVIFNWVNDVLLKSNPSNELRKVFADPTIDKDGKATNKIVSTYKKQIKEFINNGGTITTLSCIEAENLVGSEDKDIYAVRSKNGDHDCMFYAISKNADRHLIRKEYTCDTRCSYHEAREILMENWLNLDEEHKYQTAF